MMKLFAANKTALLYSAIFLLAVAGYAPALGYWFTGVDTFSLIYTGQTSALWEVLARPLMHNTSFMLYGDYWRPVIALQYWIEARLFGLQPAGYFAANLLAHGLAAVLVTDLARRLTGRLWAALLAGLLFVAHPLIIENVPVISRGQDIIMTVFMLATLRLMLAGRYRWAWLLYGLALLTKEPAVLTLPLAGLLLWMERRQLSPLLPLLAITAAYVAARAAVVGVGGYTEPNPAAWSVAYAVFFYPLLWAPWAAGQHIGPSQALALAVGSALLAGLVWLGRCRQVLGLAAAVLLPAALFAATAMQFWYFYLPAALLALLLASLAAALPVLRPPLPLLPHALLGALLLTLIFTSRPTLADWQQVGNLNRQLLTQLSNIEQRPLYLAGMPHTVAQPPGGVRGLNLLEDHSIRSYLLLTNQQPHAYILTMAQLDSLPAAMLATHNQKSDIVFISYRNAAVIKTLLHPTGVTYANHPTTTPGRVQSAVTGAAGGR